MKKNKNSGFTLIELVIAMAMLAFIMTAVISFMASGIFSYKKAKADITVHNNAQNVYNEITDTTMSANSIVMLAYINDAPGTTTVDFSYPDTDISADVKLASEPCYIVKDSAAEADFKKTAEYKERPNLQFKYYSDISPETELYIVKIIVECAENLDITECVPKVTGSYDYYDAFATEKASEGEGTQYKTIKPEKKADNSDRTDENGNIVYDTKDTVRKIYTFDGKYMFLKKKYQYMVLKNDYLNWDEASVTGGTPSTTADNMINYRFCESFSYVKLSDTETLTGIVAKVDADNATVYYELKFNDKNMTYDSQALPQIRNSYVLKPKGNKKTQSTTLGTPTDAPENDE